MWHSALACALSEATKLNDHRMSYRSYVGLEGSSGFPAVWWVGYFRRLPPLVLNAEPFSEWVVVDESRSFGARTDWIRLRRTVLPESGVKTPQSRTGAKLLILFRISSAKFCSIDDSRKRNMGRFCGRVSSPGNRKSL